MQKTDRTGTQNSQQYALSQGKHGFFQRKALGTIYQQQTRGGDPGRARKRKSPTSQAKKTEQRNRTR